MRANPSRAVFLLVLLAIASPSAVADFEPVEGGPSARLRMVGEHPNRIDFWYKSSADHCEPSSTRMSGMAGTKGGLFGRRVSRKSIGMPMTEIAPEFDFVEQAIRAGEPLTFTAQATIFDAAPGRTGWCDVHIRFVPEAGADYEVRYSHVEAAGKRGCRATLARIVTDATGKVQSTSTPFERLPSCQK